MPVWRSASISSAEGAGTMTDQWTDRLSEYLDGELTGPERTTLEAHVASCDACRTTLDELRRVVTNARALDDRPPTVDLWPGIATRIGLASRSKVRPLARRFAFTVPQLAAASVVLALVSGGAAWLIVRRGTVATPPRVVSERTPPLLNAVVYPGDAPGPARGAPPLVRQTDPPARGGGGPRLEISNFGGEIAVKTWNRNAVRVMAEHSSRDRIRVDASDQVVRVKTEAGRRGPSQIDYAVTVPAWMALNLSGVYTDIKVDGAQNEITAETVQGEITVLGGAGNVSLKSVMGAVTLEKARGRIDLSSVNEEVRATDVSGDLTAETVNGGVTLIQIESANAEASTVNGDITYDGTIKDGGHEED